MTTDPRPHRGGHSDPAREDERGGSALGEGLRWLASALWSAPEVRLRLGPAPPRGYRVAERYAIVPNAERARFLVPLADRRSAAASVSAYNALRPPKVRLTRAALAAALRAGGAARMLRDTLSVCVPEDAGDADVAGWLLGEHLRAVFDEPAVHAAIGVGRPGPFRKPVLQAFRPDGRVLGYVKAGWNDVTRGLVRTEADMLSACGRRQPSSMLVPALRGSGRWRDLETVVAAPLPEAVRRYRPRATTPPLEATLEVAGLFEPATEPLGASAYWSRAVARAAGLRGRVDDDVADAVDEYTAEAGRRHGAAKLSFGAWHGDWAPWNMALLDGRLVVWDWEHGGRLVPLGFDPLHFHFQLAFIADEQPLPPSLVRARERAEPALSGLGLSTEQANAVADLHVLEVFLRYQDAQLAGGGVNPRFSSAGVDVLRRRFRGP